MKPLSIALGCVVVIALAAGFTAEASELGVAAWVAAEGGRVGRDDSSRIREVDLGFTWVSDHDLSRLHALPHLRKLNLSLTRITDSGLEQLKTLEGLAELNLYAAEHITDMGLVHLREWTEIKSLSLRGTDITDTGLAYVAELPSLESLDISFTQVTDNGMVHLGELTELEKLSVGANKMTAQGLSVLQLLPRLKHLDLSGRQMRNSGFWSVAVTDLNIDIVASLSGLQSLNLRGLKVADLGVRKLAAPGAEVTWYYSIHRSARGTGVVKKNALDQ